MTTSSNKFAKLLTEAVYHIRLRENKIIAAVHDELGYAIGRNGGSAIEYWRRGNTPSKISDLEQLAREIAKRSDFDRTWLDLFLRSGGHPNPAELCEELFPSYSSKPIESSSAHDKQPPLGNVPPLPDLLIGREQALHDLKAHLNPAKSSTQTPSQITTIIRGWPGVGKSTLAAAIAHDLDIASRFPDGVLWVSLGPEPDTLAELLSWGRALHLDALEKATTVEEAASKLRAILRFKRVLLIVDDVWDSRHAMPFRVGGQNCALLITTRLPGIAHELAPKPEDIYALPVLREDQGLELLRILAPTVVKEHPKESLELVRELEGLPLALQVAGRLLAVEASQGWSVLDLLQELREGVRLLEEQVPANLIDLTQETIPTVAVLLQKSIDRLSPETRDYYAYLGVFAPKPATFDLEDAEAVWPVPDAKPIARILMERGLLEPIQGRFQMHALLVLHARSLLRE